MAALPTIGAQFAVTEELSFRDGDRLIAKYLKDHTYRVTDVNASFVGAMVSAGKAKITGFTRARRPAGKVTVG